MTAVLPSPSLQQAIEDYQVYFLLDSYLLSLDSSTSQGEYKNDECKVSQQTKLIFDLSVASNRWHRARFFNEPLHSRLGSHTVSHEIRYGHYTDIDCGI